MASLVHRFAKMVGESGFWRGAGRIHMRLYQWTGGRFGHSSGGFEHLLLTTVGRKSGVPRTVPLTYITEGDDIVLVASNGGADRHPAWWLNLEQTPQARIQIGPETRDVVATRATPEEWRTLWPKVKAANPFYGVYEQITERDIPVVILRSA